MIDDNKEFHPVSNIFPLMDQDALQDLTDDIRENGLLEPIWLHPDGRIIDGRNRYLACLETGYTPQYRTWDGTGSLVAFVAGMNKEKLESMSASQRACAAAEACQLLQQAKKDYYLEKKRWLCAARAAFAPGTRQPCIVCRGYESVTHAHHVFPLEIQFDRGIKEPIQEFIWLCPNHHAAIHLIIRGLIANKCVSLKGFPPEEQDLLQKEAVSFVHLCFDATGKVKKMIEQDAKVADLARRYP